MGVLQIAQGCQGRIYVMQHRAKTDKRCSPASVGTTLRVVRVKAAIPIVLLYGALSGLKLTAHAQAGCCASEATLLCNNDKRIRSAISSRFIQYLHTIY